MANVKKETPTTEIKEVVETKVDDTQLQILEMMKQLQTEMAEMKAKNEELEAKNKELSTREIYDTKTPSTDKVKLIHMLQGGTSLLTSTGKEIRFENLFEARYVKKEDLDDLVFGHKYNRIFQEIGVYVCDKSVREDFMLETYYDKYQINEKTFYEMLDMTYDEIIEKLGKMPLDLAESFATFVIDENKMGNSKAMDRGVISSVGDFFKIDIYSMLK